MKLLAGYQDLAPAADLERIQELAARLKGYTIQHVYSTSLEGGLVDMLERSLLLYEDLGLRPRWNLMVGTEEFFDICRHFQRGLTGSGAPLTGPMLSVFGEYARRNAQGLYLSADAVVTHDLQPLALVEARSRDVPWIWRCHFDLSPALPGPWRLLRRYLSKYDATIFSHARFARKVPVERYVLRPAIDPFSERNRELTPRAVRETALRLGLDVDVPIILQVANFDQAREWPRLFRLFRRLRRDVDCALVLARTATESHRGDEPFIEEIRRLAKTDGDVHLIELFPGAFHEVNALEQAATVILQPGTHQGFDLVLLEALWNRKPVVAGSVSGRLLGLVHGQTGFLMNSLADAYGYLRSLLEDPALRERISENGRKHVREHFLITRLIREYLDLFAHLEEARRPKVRSARRRRES